MNVALSHTLTSIGSIAVTIGIAWGVAEPHFNNKVEEQIDVYTAKDKFNTKIDLEIDKYLKSAKMKFYVDGVITKVQADRDRIESEKEKFDEKLAKKMNVSADEVPIRIGEMYKKFKEQN